MVSTAIGLGEREEVIFFLLSRNQRKWARSPHIPFHSSACVDLGEFKVLFSDRLGYSILQRAMTQRGGSSWAHGTRKSMEEAQHTSRALRMKLEKEMATHSNILAWEITCTEEPGGLQSMASQRVRLQRQRTYKILYLNNKGNISPMTGSSLNGYGILAMLLW